MQYTVKLNKVSRSLLNQVGTKAANLGELISQGFNVPEGYVVTVNAFRNLVATNGNGIDPDVIKNLDFPDQFQHELALIISEFKTPLAVRSSGIAEDLADKSFAGQYETVLDVKGLNELIEAIKICWESAFNERVKSYVNNSAEMESGMAVIIQKLVHADAAGVAFSVNPITGANEIMISSVKGLGERLVSGDANADEWIVKDTSVEPVKIAEDSITSDQVQSIAKVVKDIAAYFRTPQDIEWAIENGDLFLLQTRPVTSITETMTWEATEPGVWFRNFRLGEWLGQPVTPLFRTWLMEDIDNGLFSNFDRATHVPTPKPFHIVVNGWYYASGNFLPTGVLDLVRILFLHMIPNLILRPRRLMILVPPKAYWSMKLYEKEWRSSVEPEYQQIIEQGWLKLESAAVPELLELIDKTSKAAGKYFYSLVAIAGSAWKPEMVFAKFYQTQVEPVVGENHQTLLQGLGFKTARPYGHATESLDWYHPTLGEREFFDDILKSQPDNTNIEKITEHRKNLELKIAAALKDQPKKLKKFQKLLHQAQEMAILREEQIFEFTKAWPLMRAALLKVGKFLTDQNALDKTSDIFFLNRDELFALISDSEPLNQKKLIEERESLWNSQKKQSPPLTLGKMSFMVKKMFEGFENGFGASEDENGLLSGVPASPGRFTGPVRIIMSIEEFSSFKQDEILVAPVTNPAWTILFQKASAVITDNGSAMAHASLVAREYGIPAVVGTGSATKSLQNGQIVTVDGNKGIVFDNQ